MGRELFRNDISFKPDEASILKRLHCEADDEPFIRTLELLETALPLFSPSFAAREYDIDEVNEKGAVIGGRFFRSKVLAKKIKDKKSVFFYISTCGREISDYIENTEDELDKYLLGEVAYLAYVRAMQALSEDTERVLGIERYVQLCPGSVYDWSVSDVKDIFALMDGLYQKLNVRVLDSGMIEPIKSVSGLFYATEEEFASCAICPRANCDNRVMEYDEELHHQLVND